jgi:hypothetical protein
MSWNPCWPGGGRSWVGLWLGPATLQEVFRKEKEKKGASLPSLL